MSTELTERRQQILTALVNEYISCAMPVGSRTLTQRYRLGVSPATVRSELAELEEDGYVTSPHTSAGRIPTDYGYRSFVDALIDQKDFSIDDEAVRKLRENAQDLDDLLSHVASTLASFTRCLSVVVDPDDGVHYVGISSLLKQPEFHDASVAVPLFSVIEDNLALISLFGDLIATRDMPVVSIGHENTEKNLDGVSVVAKRYEKGSAQGVVAVVGPTRMDYKRALDAVSTASCAFEEVL